MRANLLWRWLFIVIIIIIIIGGVIIFIVRGPIPDPHPCIACTADKVTYLGIAEILLGVVSLGLINRIRNLKG